MKFRAIKIPKQPKPIYQFPNDGSDDRADPSYWDRFFDSANRSYNRYRTHELIRVNDVWYHRSANRYSIFMAATLEDARRAIDLLEGP